MREVLIGPGEIEPLTDSLGYQKAAMRIGKTNAPFSSRDTVLVGSGAVSMRVLS
jgi:hypothetical protein